MDKNICLRCFAFNFKFNPKAGEGTYPKLVKERFKIAQNKLPKTWCPSIFREKYLEKINFLIEEGKEFHNFLSYINSTFTDYLTMEHNFFGSSKAKETVPFYCPYRKAHDLYDKAKTYKLVEETKKEE